MSDTVVNTKQIKIFNALYSEFLSEYQKILNIPEKKIKIKTTKTLLDFKEDADKDFEAFLSCEDSCLSNFKLLKQTEVDCSKININWKYLHNLYFIVDKTKDKEIIEKSEKNILVKITKKVEMNPNFLGDLVKDLSGDIQKSLEGKDLSNLDPDTLMQSLLSGQQSIGGINFSEIISQTTEKLKLKVENGDIDINQLKNLASGIQAKK